jgi:hypothetical protein
LIHVLAASVSVSMTTGAPVTPAMARPSRKSLGFKGLLATLS